MPPKPLLKWQWTVIAFGIGIIVFLFGSFVNIREETPEPLPNETSNGEPVSAKPIEQWSMKDYEDFYESSLKEVLEEIVGVGDVMVMVNMDSTEEKVYQTDIRTGTQVTNETDNQGGNRTIDDKTRDETLVTISNGNGEEPVVVKTLKPKIRGVVVVAEGVENMQVRAWIFDVIQRALDVPAHKISIVPKKKN